MVDFQEYRKWLDDAVKFYRRLGFFSSGRFRELTHDEVAQQLISLQFDKDLAGEDQIERDWQTCDISLISCDRDRAVAPSVQSGYHVSWFLDAFESAISTSRRVFCPGQLQWKSWKLNSDCSHAPWFGVPSTPDARESVSVFLPLNDAKILLGFFSHDELSRSKPSKWLEALQWELIEMRFQLSGSEHAIWISENDTYLGIIDCISGFISDKGYQFVELWQPSQSRSSDPDEFSKSDSLQIAGYSGPSTIVCVKEDEIEKFSTRGVYPQSFFGNEPEKDEVRSFLHNPDYEVHEQLPRKKNWHFALSLPVHPVRRHYDFRHVLPLFYRGLYRIQSGDEQGGWDDWHAAAELGFPGLYEIAQQVLDALS